MAIDLSIATLSFLPERVVDIVGVLTKDPLLYIPMLGWWLIFELYYLKHRHDEIRDVDVLDNGLSAIYTGIYISPIVQGLAATAFTAPTNKTMLSFIFMGYGLFLVIVAFTKLLPRFLVTLFGWAAVDLIVSILAIFYVDNVVPIDLATIAIIVVPIFAMKLIGFFKH